MLSKKKGISLITLIVTIIVIVIIAAVAIINLNNSDYSGKSKEATFKYNLGEYKSELSTYIMNEYAKAAGNFDKATVNAYTPEDIKDILSSIKKSDINKFVIEEGELVYIGKDPDEVMWSMEQGIKVDSTVEPTEALTLSITSNSEDVTRENEIVYTFQFNREVLDFTVDDILVSFGKIGAFSKIDGKTYTLSVTNEESGSQVISVSKGKCTDSRNIQNRAASKTIIIDREDPVLISLSVTSPESGIYVEDEVITIKAIYNEKIYNSSKVEVSASECPQLVIKFGNGENRTINASSVDENEMIYNYTIVQGDKDLLTLVSYAGKVYDVIGNNSDIEASEIGGFSIAAKVKVVAGRINRGDNAPVNYTLEPSYRNPVVPVGFKTVDSNGVTWSDLDGDGYPDGWNDGLVIEDESGNQFVWVPVDGTNVPYAKWTTKNIAATNTNLSDDTIGFYGGDLGNIGTGNMSSYYTNVGTVYKVTVTGVNSGSVWGTDTYTYDSCVAKAAVHAGRLEIGETKVVYVKMTSGESSYTGTVRNGVSTSNYSSYPGSYCFVDSEPQTIIQESQINSYGGFYIARYESGLPEEVTTDIANTTYTVNTNNKSDIGRAQSKSGAIPWNYISYDNAKAVSQNFVSNDYVQSGLVTGTQWDTMLKWLQNSGTVVEGNAVDWGNYYNKNGYTVSDTWYYLSTSNPKYTYGNVTKSSGYVLLQTGKFGETIGAIAHPKNLYDIAGNLSEWTSEKYGTAAQRVFRYGSYVDSASASNYMPSYRYATSNSNNYYYLGFRMVLYVKSSNAAPIVSNITLDTSGNNLIITPTILSENRVTNYKYYIDGNLVANTESNLFTFNPEEITSSIENDYGYTYNIKVVATSSNGVSGELAKECSVGIITIRDNSNNDVVSVSRTLYNNNESFYFTARDKSSTDGMISSGVIRFQMPANVIVYYQMYSNYGDDYDFSIGTVQVLPQQSGEPQYGVIAQTTKDNLSINSSFTNYYNNRTFVMHGSAPQSGKTFTGYITKVTSLDGTMTYKLRLEN